MKYRFPKWERKSERMIMLTFVMVTLLEVAAVALIITGFIFEPKLIKFEEEFVEVLKLMPKFFKALAKRAKRKLSR